MKTKIVVSLALALALVGAAAALFACSQTPTSTPVRTFERAQRMDVVCLQVFDPVTGNPIVPVPLRQEECAPVPPNVVGGGLVNQLFALVTQTSRGEVAVVDLSAGTLIDQKTAIPGINFLPVGALPTDIAVTPDGQMAFVGAAEPNKAAIYGVATRRILGDTTPNRPADPDGPATLASWPVCALPQNPGALTVVPRRSAGQPIPIPTDAGAPVDPGPDYELVAVLPGDRRSSAKIVTIDPRPFLRGAHAGSPGQGPVLAPGSLAPCPITAAVELVGQDAVPATVNLGSTWGDGVKYVDGGPDLACDRPAPRACPLPSCCGADAGTTSGAGDGGCSAAASQPLSLALGPLDPPRLVAAARDDQMLYVADASLPLVHVIDLSIPGAPRELPPFVATSRANPSRAVSIRDLAVSPPTRDYQRFLYAVDRDEGSILVYDVTDPVNASRVPMRRPHPELNPFQPEDRVSFATPVITVSFARHDFPLSQLRLVSLPSAKTGVLCNPNANLDAPGVVPEAVDEFGYFYRASSSDPGAAIGPTRLRGIFAFATLANGQVVAIDVDDWDAPCRRPTLLSPVVPPGRPDITAPPTSSLAVPEPAPSSPQDFDPYHAPVAPVGAVTDEIYFPVSMPHRMRSDSLFRSDSSSGNHVPRLDGTPTLSTNGIPLAFSGPGSEKTPLILPTGTLPTTPSAAVLGIQFSTEVPDVHIDQDWTLTYEGALPGFDGLSAVVKTEAELAGGKPGDYQALVLSNPEGRFCAKGVSDWTQGGERATAIAAELATHGGVTPDRLDHQIADYVQLTEDLLPSDDPYWSLADDPGQCWGGLPAGQPRYDACSAVFASASGQRPERDFPILEAYTDRLVVGRFFTPASGVREVVGRDTSSPPFLKMMRCCFHHQVRFHVRTAGEWSLVGTAPGGAPGLGFLSHMVPDAAGRCGPSCDPHVAFLDARAPAIPTKPAGGTLTPPARNSALALRNPMFSFWMIDGVGNSTAPTRDTVYTFHTRGQFSALLVSIGAGTISVNPQSMRYVETLGQIAVVDGASQGLVLIDLGGVAIARAPYF